MDVVSCDLFVIWLFFFNGAATTESYTYRHTLSRHGALPISRHRIAICDGAHCASQAAADLLLLARMDVKLVAQVDGCGKAIDLGDRSEEHTSELQSLMRISYTVFCLKKKKHI